MLRNNFKYLIVGLLFGVVFVKAEVVSWFRIQEMFRLQSFHMYGIIGSAVMVAMLSIWLIKKFGVKTLSGEPITIKPKEFNKGQIPGAFNLPIFSDEERVKLGTLYKRGITSCSFIIPILSAISIRVDKVSG